jgi:hypothetical protein
LFSLTYLHEGEAVAPEKNLTIILIEVDSSQALSELQCCYIYGDDHHEFRFKQYTPIKVAKYPDRYFLYVLYSEEELALLYERVDMTHRVEPIDYLMYCKRDAPHKTFRADDMEMIAKLGEFKFAPFPTRVYGEKPKHNSPYQYVLGEIFGSIDSVDEKKNLIVVFDRENAMLGWLDLLINAIKFPEAQVAVGKVFTDWAFALTGVTNEIERLSEVCDDDEPTIIAHTSQIPSENLNFRVIKNSHAVQILSRLKR